MHNSDANQPVDPLEAEIDELQAELPGLQGKARQLIEAHLAELLRQRQARIQTGGGAYVGGNVTASTFVGRDQHVYLNASQPPEELLRAYYRWLAGECARLPLGVIDARFVRTSGEVQVPLPDIYVDLEVSAPPDPRKESDRRAWALRLERGEGSERQPLLEALAQKGNRLAVLLGEAGSGKSTFVNYLAHLLALQAAQMGQGAALPEVFAGRLPVRLVLRQAAGAIPANASQGRAEMLWQALRGELVACLGAEAAQALLPYLQERLLAQGGVFLLDGLDEVPAAQHRRKALLEAVSDLAKVLPDKARLLVTARPYAYADPDWRLAGFTSLALSPFNEKQVERFVGRWYQAVRPSLGWSEAVAAERGQCLQAALQARAYLADLACRPLLLTLMATLHSSWGQLPEDRADLYEETVRLLLSRWQQARYSLGPDGQPLLEAGIQQVLGVGEGPLRAALERLALQAHTRQGQGKGRDQAAADISDGELLVAFRPLLEAAAPDALLGYLKERAGLLFARQEGVYAFPHRSFQEYLAACCLANRPDFGEELEKLACADPAWWREVCLLGVGKARQGGLGQAAGVVNALLPDDPPEAGARLPENQWRLAVLAGQALLELRLLEKGGEVKQFQALLRRARRWLAALLEHGALKARERAEAGDVLARLGDPRFDPERWFLPDEPLLGFVHIPAGTFLMGSDDRRNPDAQDRETPQHEVHLPDCWLGRYPVTVAQFRAFVQDSGYQPRYADSLGSLENHPVVNVTWHDAQAYCRWLTGKLQAQARQALQGGPALDEISLAFWQGLAGGGLQAVLPSEAEWEKAACWEIEPRSGKFALRKRVYPWGDDFDVGKANIRETGIGSTSAVGCFPGGVSPYGLLDMSGNVWEWTRSLFKDYSYRAEDGREDAASNEYRVLRGGSWDDGEVGARCAYRLDYPPGYVWRNYGFRVGVAALPHASVL